MSARFQPNCLPTAIGSLPHTDPQQACSLIASFLRDIPAWPQLPRRSFLENMYVQFSQGFPGVVIDSQRERIYVNRSQELDQPLEQLYAAYLEGSDHRYSVGPEYAAGLHAFLSFDIGKPLAVKGQLIGPVSWGLTVSDQEHRPILYDDVLADALAKLLRLKAGWQERVLRPISANTVIFIDEPYMASFGSAFVSLSRDKAISLLEEVFSGIAGLKGVHCCGNTDWSVLLSTSADIISYDTYDYGHTLSLYPDEVKSFLERRGIVAWGIVPNEEKNLARESASSLADRLEEAIAPFTRKGIPFRSLLENSLLTPSCGLASLSIEGAEQALNLLSAVSQRFRKRYLRGG